MRTRFLIGLAAGNALAIGWTLVGSVSAAQAHQLVIPFERYQAVEFALPEQPDEADGAADEADAPPDDAEIVEPLPLPAPDAADLPAEEGPGDATEQDWRTARFSALFKVPEEEPVSSRWSESALEQTIGPLPLVYDPKVERHIRFFNSAIRDRFEQWLTRFGHYRPLVERIFAEFNLPPDLVFLSLVESGFNPHAYSRARATGPWQFMKGTAKLYGLRVDRYVDERRDPIKSTVAAARYLRDLYDLFGTWPLAMAAYNAGEGKVLRALQKSRAESFWEIARTRHLRRETREYVPRFIAAAIIAKNPSQFGFAEDSPDVHEFEEVVVRRPVHLRDVATAAGLSYEELRRLNPELRRQVTPPGEKEYRLKVPVGAQATVEQKLDQIKPWKGPRFVERKGKGFAKAPPSGWYRVRVGDSLWTIARRFGLTVRELKELNNLRGRLIRAGDLLAVTP